MTAYRSAFSRKALAAALALGVAGATLGAAPAQAAGPSYSKGFSAVAAPMGAAIEKASKSKDPAAIADLKKQLDAAIAAASTPDDKDACGSYAIKIGSLAGDNSLLRKGVTLRLEAGKVPADQLGTLHFYAGNFALEAQEYDLARKELEASAAAGNKDPDVQLLLAQTYLQQKQEKEALPHLLSAIDLQAAAGKPVPESWMRSAMATAYGMNDYTTALPLANKLVRAYPTPKNWSLAIIVLRDLAKLPSQDTLDLLRLMVRTNSFTEERDYAEFVQAADVRRNPGEVKAVIDAGVAAGRVDANKQFYAENLKLAAQRIPGDKASLPGLEKDAMAPGAPGVRITGAADAFLSYGEGAKAASLYKMALDKPGIDKPTVLTRLGIAQIDSGDYAGAQATLAQVDGVRTGMAQLWAAYAAAKAAGK